MIKHNICARIGGNLIAFYQFLKAVHQHHRLFFRNLKIVFCIEYVTLIFSILLTIGQAHDVLFDVIFAHLSLYSLAFSYYLINWQKVEQNILKFLSFSRHSFKKFKVNSMDYYLQKKLNK